LRKKNILILSLIILELIISSYILFKKIPLTFSKNELAEYPIGEITKEVKISQYIKLEDVNFDTVEIKFATYNRENSANINMSLYKNDTKIKDAILDSSEIKDNEFFALPIPNVTFKKNDVLRIDFNSDNAIPGDAYTIWASNSDVIEGDLVKDGEIMNGDLNIKLGREGYKYEQLFYMLNQLPVSPSISIPIIFVLFLALNLLVILLIRKKIY